MRRLKSLNRDPVARREVAKASSQSQSGDTMDFGLLCYERGLMEGARIGGQVMEECLLVGSPESYCRLPRCSENT